jgi:hypothetical protein
MTCGIADGLFARNWLSGSVWISYTETLGWSLGYGLGRTPGTTPKAICVSRIFISNSASVPTSLRCCSDVMPRGQSFSLLGELVDPLLLVQDQTGQLAQHVDLGERSVQQVVDVGCRDEHVAGHQRPIPPELPLERVDLDRAAPERVVEGDPALDPASQVIRALAGDEAAVDGGEQRMLWEASQPRKPPSQHDARLEGLPDERLRKLASDPRLTRRSQP